jgi:hypothetical protein
VSLKHGILCVSVLVILTFPVSKAYRASADRALTTPSKEETKEREIKAEMPRAVEERKETLNIPSLTTISEKNIFSPERKDFPIQAGPVKKPVVRPQIILYGVTMAGDYQSASISNPGRPLKKGEREAMTLKIGDRIGEYKLSKILPDRIALEAIEDTFEVLLYDPNKPKHRVYAKAETKPASITTVLPTSPASSATSSASSQITPSQEAPKAAESIRESAARTPVPVTSSSPPYPQPTLRSRRTSAGADIASPSTPIGLTGTLTQPKNL